MFESIRTIPLSIVLSIAVYSCSTNSVQDDANNTEEQNTSLYQIESGVLTKAGKPFAPIGVNALNSFGVDNTQLMSTWNVRIVREFIGNLKEQPISGNPIQDSRGVFLHSLEAIVNQHRLENRIVILCPFGWVNTNGERILFTGLNPSDQTFFEDYKTKMTAIADFFKGQEDVWIQVWNEPYSFNNSNNYSHKLWYDDNVEMIDNLRSINGFDNIILVAGNEQGQGEEAILEKGHALLKHDPQILFDIHAYGKWHENATIESISNRLNILMENKLPIIFGEVGVITEDAPLSDPSNFLEACKTTNVGALAWLWNKNSSDQNSLLTEDGLPNNTNNNNWGTIFQNFLRGN